MTTRRNNHVVTTFAMIQAVLQVQKTEIKIYCTMSLHEILYTLVSLNQVPLAHYSGYSGTAKAFCQKFLQEVDVQGPLRQSFSYDHRFTLHVLNNITDPHFSFLCLTGSEYDQSLAFAYLEELRVQFLERFHDRYDATSIIPYEMNDFSDTIRKLSSYYLSTKWENQKPPTWNQQAIPLVVLDLEADSSFIKYPLLVKHIQDPDLLLHGPARKKHQFLSQFLLKHPFINIGVFVFLALAVFVYFVLVVPLCGQYFDKTNDKGERICWFS
ncbi:Vesicle-trafficking protein SEC22b [Balamuthia mandrillaris]